MNNCIDCKIELVLDSNGLLEAIGCKDGDRCQDCFKIFKEKRTEGRRKLLESKPEIITTEVLSAFSEFKKPLGIFELANVAYRTYIARVVGYNTDDELISLLDEKIPFYQLTDNEKMAWMDVVNSCRQR